ncbi:MAG: hypothetical protein LBV21_07005, partial [Candidatus Adiutrix sp.]|nr:hypothetical protein [Candidatus Adiutrix sp.]
KKLRPILLYCIWPQLLSLSVKPDLFTHNLLHLPARRRQDSINNAGGGNDLLAFEGLNPDDLWFSQIGDHLTAGLAGAQDQVMANNWFAAGDYKIDRIKAAGMPWRRPRWPC